MPKFNYIALDQRGNETKGSIEVGSQNEAIGRVKEMGLFPTKITESEKEEKAAAAASAAAAEIQRKAKAVHKRIWETGGDLASRTATLARLRAGLNYHGQPPPAPPHAAGAGLLSKRLRS